VTPSPDFPRICPSLVVDVVGMVLKYRCADFVMKARARGIEIQREFYCTPEFPKSNFPHMNTDIPRALYVLPPRVGWNWLAVGTLGSRGISARCGNNYRGERSAWIKVIDQTALARGNETVYQTDIDV
jgi:hypothetical protein